MTREEAIANLNMISVAFVEPITKEQRKLINDTFDMAIKALSQEPICDRDCEHCTWTECPIEPCDDVVSREKVLEMITDFATLELYIDKHNHVTFEPLEKLIKSLPSVTQKPGKWIKIQSGDKDFPESIVCSKCGSENSHLDFNENAEPIGKVFVTSKYCPNCGAKMESEDKG